MSLSISEGEKERGRREREVDGLARESCRFYHVRNYYVRSQFIKYTSVSNLL